MNNISNSTAAFLAKYIQSIGQLEVLLFLYTNQNRGCTAEEISQELRTNVSWVAGELEKFCSADLLIKEKSNTTYLFQPKALELRPTISDLAKCYSNYRYSIIDLIYNKANEQAKEFVNAFRIKRKH